jgi:OOP family OmpA-OmpF porin
MKKIWMLTGILLLVMLTRAQVLKRMSDRAQRKVESNVGKKVDKTIDDAMSGKKKKGTTNNSGSSGSTDDQTPSTGGPSLKSYSKFDFIPGEKVIVMEDFSQDAIGDFPDKWNTNSTGELVTVENRPGKWLSLSKDGVYMPEFITSLPENCTLELELLCNPDYSFYSTPFYIYLADLKNRSSFSGYKFLGPAKRDGIEVSLKPLDASLKVGEFGYKVWENGKETMNNKTKTSQFHARTQHYVKISMWRQKQRLRVYLNEEKIMDVPRAFAADKKYNTLLFMTGRTHSDKDRFLISNLRLAVGQPDTRHKLLNEGKFVTSGILFDVNSATIRGESFGALKDIAEVLKANASVKVKIVGHTDNDGDDASNLDLSKRRAESVKKALANEFGIESSRLETDGKGESQPVDKNNTSEGKSNNRRVEFIKL